MTEKFSALLSLWRTGMVLSHEVAEELVTLAPSGTFTALPNVRTLGVGNVQQFNLNTHEVRERHNHAMDAGCYLEVIALRVQHMELWLRMFWVTKNRKQKVLGPADKRTFGEVINCCENAGFSSELIGDLKAFNDVRNDAIHKYVLGDIAYDDLKRAAQDHAGLDSRIVDYVTQAIARPATADDMTGGLGTVILVQEPILPD